jgi:hypothetical protein
VGECAETYGGTGQKNVQRFNPIERGTQMKTYAEICAYASKEQGIDALIEELAKLGVKSESAQTGGFTMCAYIELSGERYIYANPYGAGVYDADDYETDLIQLDEPNSAEVAQVVAQWLGENK